MFLRGDTSLVEQDLHQLAQLEDAMKPDALRGKLLLPAAFAVDQHRDVADLQTGLPQWLDRVELAGAGGDEIVQYDYGLTGLEMPLDRPLCAVAFALLARID